MTWRPPRQHVRDLARAVLDNVERSMLCTGYTGDLAAMIQDELAQAEWAPRNDGVSTTHDPLWKRQQLHHEIATMIERAIARLMGVHPFDDDPFLALSMWCREHRDEARAHDALDRVRDTIVTTGRWVDV